MNHEELRTRHYERLNGYRHSAEYADYAKVVGTEVPQGDLPCLIGSRWEIDEELYDHFLEILPPLGWRCGSFYMREFTFDDITAKFTTEGGKFYCEFAR